MLTKFDLAQWRTLTSFSPSSEIRVCWIRKGFWHKAHVETIKPVVVTASEEERPTLIECLLYAKIYAKTSPCIHSHNNLPFLLQKSSKSGKASLAIPKKQPPEKSSSLCCSLLLHPSQRSPSSWPWFARWGHVNSCARIPCKCVCLYRWGRPQVQAWQLAQEAMCPPSKPGTQRKERVKKG